MCVCVYTLGYEWRGDLFDPFDWLEGGQGDPSYRDPTRSLSSFSRSKDINFPELKKEKNENDWKIIISFFINRIYKTEKKEEEMR